MPRGDDQRERVYGRFLPNEQDRAAELRGLGARRLRRQERLATEHRSLRTEEKIASREAVLGRQERREREADAVRSIVTPQFARPAFSERGWGSLHLHDRLAALVALERALAPLHGRLPATVTAISETVATKAKPRWGDNELGRYNEDDRVIKIRLRAIQDDDPRVALRTYLHEAWHSYQSDIMAEPRWLEDGRESASLRELWQDARRNYPNMQPTGKPWRDALQLEKYRRNAYELSAFRYESLIVKELDDRRFF